MQFSRLLKDRKVRLSILGALIFVAILMLGQIIFDSSFLQDFFSNGLSTLLGVVIGIPVALLVNGILEEKTVKERKKKVLTVLLSELTYDIKLLEPLVHRDNDAPLDDDKYSDFSIQLKDESWQAFKGGGELEWIKNPVLLEKIATTYHYVNVLKKISERFFTLVISSGGAVRANDINLMTRKINAGAKPVMDYLNEAKKLIEDELK